MDNYVGRHIWLILAVFVFALSAFLWPALWTIVGVSPLKPAFADARVITAGWESQSHGFDPMRENPSDPWGRPMNYPRIWKIPGHWVHTQDSTLAVGFLIWGIFFLGMIIFLWSTRSPFVASLVFSVFSPSVMFGLERANIDLVIFALVVMASLQLRSRPVRFAGLALFGFILKIYPIVLLPFLLVLKKPMRKVFAVSAIAALIYISLFWHDFVLIRKSTPVWAFSSYGFETILIYSSNHPRVAWIVRIGQLLGLLAPFLAAFKLPERYDHEVTDREACFFGGASVFCFTFVLGTNFDYRLVFLVLCVPALISEVVIFSKRISKYLLILILSALWLPLIEKVGTTILPLSLNAIPFLVAQLLTWLLFIALATILLRRFYYTILFRRSGV